MKNSFVNADSIKLEYRFLHLLASFYVIIFLTAQVINLKIIKLDHLILHGEVITYPFLYGMLVMVMEIYGFERTRQLIWITVLSYLIFVAFISITMIFPSPEFWTEANEYNFILGLLVQHYYSGVITFLITAFLTCYIYQLLSDSNAFLSSQKLKFILSAGFGVATHLTLSRNIISIAQEDQIYIDSFFVMTTTFGIIALFSKLSRFLRKQERISKFQDKISFNPFSLKAYVNIAHNNFKSFKLYHYVAVLFILFFVISKVGGAKFISIHGFVFTSGSLIFPVSYIFSDILTEVYGFERARQLIWIAVICNCLFVVFLFFTLIAPYPEHWKLQEMFNTVFGMQFRMAFTSALCYFLGDYVNCRVLSKLKIKYAGRRMWLRFLGSTVVGASLDVSLFTLLSFSFVAPAKELMKLITCESLFKISYEMVMLPVTIRVCNLLKRVEKIDVYDFKTNFSPFSMRVNYDGKENLYK